MAMVSGEVIAASICIHCWHVSAGTSHRVLCWITIDHLHVFRWRHDVQEGEGYFLVKAIIGPL